MRYKGNNDGVPKLFVCLRVGNHDAVFIRIALKAGTFSWRELPWVFALLADENFRAVFIISCAQRPCLPVEVGHAETETVAFCPMLFRIILQILPQFVAQRVAADALVF